MDHSHVIERQARALDSLHSAIPSLQKSAMAQNELKEVCKLGIFTPAQDERISYWFAMFITIRSNLWSIVETAIEYSGGTKPLSERHDYQYFVLGYSAVCALIRIDRFLVTKVANHSVIQRKLNEPFPTHRIRRKQFNKIYKAMFQPGNAIRIHQAHRLFKKKRKAILSAVQNTPVQDIYEGLAQQERYIDLRWRQYFKAWLASRKLAWKRRGASAKQKSIFTVLEYSGRLASELSLPRPKKVTSEVRGELARILQPGDIFITRHGHALTNLFLPGFWPHAALYVGFDTDRSNLNINAAPEKLALWVGQQCTLEALKDGVHFRSLDETLSVDAFVVMRPKLSKQGISEALGRAANHVGKGYNFDFDFFRSDQLVCTEVIFRAFDGIDGELIPLKERMGRKTLSAEDLLDFSLDTGWAKPVAIFGVGDSKNTLLSDKDALKALWQSYR